MRPRTRHGIKVLGMALGLLACAGVHGAPRASPVPRAPSTQPRRLASAPTTLDTGNVDRLRLKWEAAVGGFGRAVAVHRDRQRVFVTTEVTSAVHDFSTGRRAAAAPRCDGALRGGMAVYGADVLVACERTLLRFDAATLRPRDTPKPFAAPATAAAFSREHVALGHRDGVIRIYPLAGGATVEIPVPGPPIDVKSLALAPDASVVAVAWVQGSIWWWRTSEPATFHDVVRHPNESDTLAFDGAGVLLAEEGEPEYTNVWKLGAPSERAARVRNGDWVKRLIFVAQDRWLVRGGSDGLELAEVGGPRRIALDTSVPVEDVALDERGASIAAVDRRGRLTLWALP